MSGTNFRRTLLVVVFLLAAVSAWSEEAYQAELATMKQAVAAFDRASELIENATDVQQMTAALSTTADELEAVFPEMTAVTKAHPDWGREPPESVKPTMALFQGATNRLFDKALKKALAFANEHQDSEELQKAFGKVNSILYRR